ncbi:probable G-protein coupled receptor 156 [Megalops cyprinoides]|uniref:probable G-protein coupled receptor 156 n=1 Tax=Megalops cyprinoides TaxID=118141 RepID=UPI001864E43B|nr:probable G-protein coupled receptor 156 [Megalops cyprinoides]
MTSSKDENIVDKTGRALAPAMNCSVECKSSSCSIDPEIDSQEAWGVLQQLCSFTPVNMEVQRRPLSSVLCAVVWTLLSCGIMLALFFLGFTLRFRNNRIVKMSSPNLNVLTLCGSVLTYSSGFLFAIEERSLLPGTSPKTILQARVWTLCIGSSLVFGPILGKTWRLYRVFTQRVPDRRVIIRDIQLMGLVALLILVDILVLAIWSLTDPVQCARSIGAVVKVVERDVSYSLSQLDSCSSSYSDIWVILLSTLKGSLLFYGTYLAGLTSNVSSPPVNQSPTIMAAVCLVTLSASVIVPISKLLHAWPNVVYSVITGAIFSCTLAINCLLFVPQLTQWKQFEDELNPSPSQMAKYFSSPSKSLHSMYSEDEIYYLLGENNSMKRLLTEKNAMIDSLQEQVENAKDKLLRLMSASSPPEEQEMDSNTTNLNSSTTQVMELQPEPSIPLLETETDPPSAHLTADQLQRGAHDHVTHSPEGKLECVSHIVRVNCDFERVQLQVITGPAGSSGLGNSMTEDPPQVIAVPITRSSKDSPQLPTDLSLTETRPLDPSGEQMTVAVTGSKPGFVSSEQLQEILQDLCLDAVSTSLRSPRQVRSPSNPSLNEPSARSLRSPPSPAHFFYPSISPYVMRKRRPPFHTSRGKTPPYYYQGSVPPTGHRGKASSHMGRHMSTSSPKAEPPSVESQPLCTDLGKGSNGVERVFESEAIQVPQRRGRCGLKWDMHKPCMISPFSTSHPELPTIKMEGFQGVPEQDQGPYSYSDSDSSSSEDNYCYYHRPYCNACLPGPYESTESTISETSDSEFSSLQSYCRQNHPEVNFKEDLKPTFV